MMKLRDRALELLERLFDWLDAREIARNHERYEQIVAKRKDDQEDV